MKRRLFVSLKMYFVARWKLAFRRNLLKCSSDFDFFSLQTANFAATKYGIDFFRTGTLSYGCRPKQQQVILAQGG